LMCLTEFKFLYITQSFVFRLKHFLAYNHSKFKY